MRLTAAALLLVGVPVVISAQTPPDPVLVVDAGRLVLARKLMDQVMPPASRNQMIATMMGSMNQAMLQSMRSNPDLEKAMATDPNARPIFERFMQRQQKIGTEQLTAGLPAMIEAMAHAYARRFTLVQLTDIGTFFASPTGQVYLAQSPTIMSDPDVSAWMSTLMSGSMKRMPDEVARLIAELKASNKSADHGG